MTQDSLGATKNGDRILQARFDNTRIPQGLDHEGRSVREAAGEARKWRGATYSN